MRDVFSGVPAEVRGVLERQARAWQAGDPDAVAADFAEDAVFLAPHQAFRGRDAIRAAAAGFFAAVSEVRIDVKRLCVSADGTRGVVEWAWAQTPRDGGPPRLADDAIAFELRGGRLTAWREYINWRA